jgi:hypothetical protein
LVANRAPAQDKDQIKVAIQRGVEHLRFLQRDDGYWPHPEKAGLTALNGLALLHAFLQLIPVSPKQPATSVNSFPKSHTRIHSP